MFDIIIGSKSVCGTRMIYDKNELGGKDIVDQLYPPLAKTIGASVSTIDIGGHTTRQNLRFLNKWRLEV